MLQIHIQKHKYDRKYMWNFKTTVYQTIRAFHCYEWRLWTYQLTLIELGKSYPPLFPPLPSVFLNIYNAIDVWQRFFYWNVSSGLVDTQFHGIQNGTRHSGSLIKCYRKAILFKVTCIALHQVTVMSILKPKHWQVAFISLFCSESITNTTLIQVLPKDTNKPIL